jgi:hypothetical protein
VIRPWHAQAAGSRRFLAGNCDRSEWQATGRANHHCGIGCHSPALSPPLNRPEVDAIYSIRDKPAHPHLDNDSQGRIDDLRRLFSPMGFATVMAASAELQTLGFRV